MVLLGSRKFVGLGRGSLGLVDQGQRMVRAADLELGIHGTAIDQGLDKVEVADLNKDVELKGIVAKRIGLAKVSRTKLVELVGT